MQSNVRNLNDFIQVDEKQTSNYNKDIVMTDLQGNAKTICSCYCTIVSYQSISYHISILEPQIFESQKETIQVEIDKFKEEAEKIAREHNVPVI